MFLICKKKSRCFSDMLYQTCYIAPCLVLGQSEEFILDWSYMARSHWICNEMCDYGQLILYAVAVHALWLNSQIYSVPCMLWDTCYLGHLVAFYLCVKLSLWYAVQRGIHICIEQPMTSVTWLLYNMNTCTQSHIIAFLVFTVSKVLFAWKPMRQFLMYVRARTGL